MPPTFAVRTRPGRRHVYFRQPDETPLTNKEGALTALPCEVRGIGGYVAGPGSVHPEAGTTYLPEEPLLPVAPCPAWLVEALTERPTKTGSATSFDLGALPDIIPRGHRREAIFRKAASCRAKGMDFADAWSIAENWWRRCEQTAAEPFTWAEAQAQVIDVWERYEGTKETKEVPTMGLVGLLSYSQGQIGPC